LAVILVVAAGAWFLYVKNTAPKSGRHEFSFTQVVGSNTSDGCVHLTYDDKDYCIDEWAKVYAVLSEADKKTSSTKDTTVKVNFDADFHSGTKMFVGDKEIPTIFLDKVYSATATKQ
jgi:hypothetical protein